MLLLYINKQLQMFVSLLQLGCLFIVNALTVLNVVALVTGRALNFSSNLRHYSLISSLSNKEPTYVVLASNLEDGSVSFLHVRALCPVPL
jgi:hypothetical protein